MVNETQNLINPLPADRLVGEVMTRDVVTLSPEMSVYQAWKSMLENRVKAMPVVSQGNKVVGILTDEDLLERAGIHERLSVAIRLDSSVVDQELVSLQSSPLTVAEVMTKPVITAWETDSLRVAAVRMVKAGLKRMPVLDTHARLVGVLSRLDILRQVVGETSTKSLVYPSTQNMRTLRDVMSPEVPTVRQDDSLAALVEKFLSIDTHRLIVVDAQGKAVGLVSDSDVVARISPAQQRSMLDALRLGRKPPAGKETARDLMSPGPLTASPDLSVVLGVRKMLKEGRKWMVVVDADNHPLGLVDRQILLEALATTA